MSRQKVLAWKLETPGQPVQTSDGYGNVLHVLTLDKPFSEIRIRAAGLIETSPTVDEPSDFTGVTLSPLLFLRITALTRTDEKLAAFAEGFRRRAGTLSGLRELAAAVQKKLPEAGASSGVASSFFLAATRSASSRCFVATNCGSASLSCLNRARSASSARIWRSV